MRLLIYSQANSQHTVNFVEQCIQFGLTVGLVTHETDRSTYPAAVERFTLKSFYKARFPGEGLLHLWKETRAIARHFHPDIVHGHYITDSGIRAYLSGARPLVLTAWGSDILLEPERLSLFRKFLFRRTLANSSGITSNNNRILQKLMGYAPNAKPTIYRFGINGKSFLKTKPNNRNRLRSEISIPENSFVILSPRNLAPVYNIETIIRAFHRLPEGYFLLFKYFAVEPSYLEKLKTLTDSLDLEHRIRWVGKVPHRELPKYYHASDVVISVPDSDSLPVTFFESWASSTPLICGFLATYSEILHNNLNCTLVNHRNPEEIANAIQAIHNDVIFMETLISEGLTSFYNYGNKDKEFERLLNLYKELLEACA